MGPGENAGAVDVGDGYAVAFKVESHNHPSAVEPFQGAATGVGGILRDVFAIGARPIAILDSLRFGELDSARSRYLLDGAVAGIGHYGNSIGVPTVGGEIYFEAPYEHNCLVNAMCVGLAKTDEMIRAAAAGVGNVVVLMGASTGPRRDRRRLGAGLGRARRRRRREAPDGADRRPVRGVEAARVLPRAARARACWSRCRTSAPRASPPRRPRWPRRAASGSTSTSAGCRCARPTWSRSRSWSPSPRSGCSAWSSPARSPRCSAVCENWQTGAAAIGDVTDSGQVRVLRRRRGRRRHAGRGAGRRLPALRPRARPSRTAGSTATARRSTARRRDPGETLLALLASPSVASKRWAFEQYDSVVGSRTVRRPEPADAAVLQIPEAGNAIAVSIDGNGRRVACDPYAGHDRGGARVRPEPRLRRRRAARPDQLPQLRQPREAGTSPGSSTARSAASPTPATRSASRSSAATSRSTTRAGQGPIYPTPGRRHGRRAARPGAAPAASRFAEQGDAIAAASARSPHRSRARSWRSCAASSAPGLPPAPTSPRCAAALRHGPRRRPRRQRHLRPRHQRRRPRLRARRVRDRRRRRLPRRPRAAGRARGCSPEDGALRRGAGGFLLSGERVRSRRSGRRVIGRGRRHHDRGRRRRPHASPSGSAPPRAPGSRWASQAERGGA